MVGEFSPIFGDFCVKSEKGNFTRLLWKFDDKLRLRVASIWGGGSVRVGQGEEVKVIR